MKMVKWEIRNLTLLVILIFKEKKNGKKEEEEEVPNRKYLIDTVLLLFFFFNIFVGIPHNTTQVLHATIKSSWSYLAQ